MAAEAKGTRTKSPANRKLYIYEDLTTDAAEDRSLVFRQVEGPYRSKAECEKACESLPDGDYYFKEDAGGKHVEAVTVKRVTDLP